MRLRSFVLGLFLVASAFGSFGTTSPQPDVQPRRGLPNFFKKLEEGKGVAIAYFGGSITAQDGWRPKTLKWFRQQYTNAAIDEIHAAVGGTGSDLGVFRFQQDVIAHQPDLVFVEFAVNDAGASFDQILRCIEGIVRQGWKADPTIDFCFVYTIAGNMLNTYQTGRKPRSVTAMETVAEHYGIPSINLGPEVARLEAEGKLIFKGPKPKTDEEKEALKGKLLFSPDGVHPYPEGGHDLYVEAIVRAIASIRSTGEPGPHATGESLMSDHYEKAKLVSLSRAQLSPGWQKLSSTNAVAKRVRKQLPQLYKAEKPGDSITLKFKGTYLAIYDVLGPDCGQVTITLDDKPVVTKPRFDGFATYHRVGTLKIGENLPNGIHTVKLEISPEPPDKVKILEQRKEKMDDPSRYNGTAWYAGALLLIGDVVKD